MNIFFDTEFDDNGKSVELISIGLVSESGHTYYAESSEYNRKDANEWLQDNVINNLVSDGKQLKQIRHEIIYWIDKEKKFMQASDISFWAYFCTWDWYLFVRLISKTGLLVDLPENYPQFCNDLQSYMYIENKLHLKYELENDNKHNALEDAIWNKKLYELLFKK